MIKAFIFSCCVSLLLLLIIPPSWSWLPTADELEDLLKNPDKQAREEAVLQILAEPDSVLILWLQLSMGAHNYTPLHCCAKWGDLELLQKFLQRKKSLVAIATKSDGLTLLHCAALNNHVHVVQYLLDQGISSVGGIRRPSPLNLAVTRNHLGVVECLLDNGASVSPVGDCVTPLIGAIWEGYSLIVACLLKHGASVTAVNNQGTIPLHLAARMGHLEIVVYLLEYGALVTAVDDNSWTALHHAASRGNLPIVESLIVHGALVSAVDNRGSTPLHCAALNSNLSVVRWLIVHGALVSAVDNDGQTALHYAASNDGLEVVQCLLNHGALVTEVDNSGQTALHFAASNGDLPVVLCLIVRGALVTARDSRDMTPLHNAVWFNRLQLIPCLFAHWSIAAMDHGFAVLRFPVVNNRQTQLQCRLTHEASEEMTAVDSNGEISSVITMRWRLKTTANPLLVSPDLPLTPPRLGRIASFTIWRAVGSLKQLKALFDGSLPPGLLMIILVELGFKSFQNP